MNTYVPDITVYIDELKLQNELIPTSTPMTSNLLKNPGFERGELNPWYATKYPNPYEKSELIDIGVDTEARFEGEYGAFIDIKSNRGDWGRIIQKPVEITPGEKLIVEAKLMYEDNLNDGFAEMCLVFLDEEQKYVDFVHKYYYTSDFCDKDEWISAVLPTTTAPSNAKKVMVGFANVKSSRLNIDNVILKYASAIVNPPPTATKLKPASDSISIELGESQEFKVMAEDPDEDVHNNLRIVSWFVDDVWIETDPVDGKSAEARFNYSFEKEGTFYVKATVYNEQMEEASVTWEVNVRATQRNEKILLEKYPLDIGHILISKKLGGSDKIIYQIIVESNKNATSSLYWPEDASVMFSVSKNVYIYYDEIKIEYGYFEDCSRPSDYIPEMEGKGDYQIYYNPSIEEISKKEIKKSFIKQIEGMLPLLGPFLGWFNFLSEAEKSVPLYHWGRWEVIQYDDQNPYIEDKITEPSSKLEIIQRIEGETEEEINSRHGDTIRYSHDAFEDISKKLLKTLQKPEDMIPNYIENGTEGWVNQNTPKSVKFTIPLKLKETTENREIRLWIDSIYYWKPAQSRKKICLILEDLDITGGFEALNHNTA